MQALQGTSSAAGSPARHNSCSSIAAKCLNWQHRLGKCSRGHNSPSKHLQPVANTVDSISSSGVSKPRLQQWRQTAAAAASVQPSSKSKPQQHIPPYQQQRQASAIPAVGSQLPVSCVRLGTEGLGVCHAVEPPSSFVLLIKGALPGEQLLAKITAVKKGYAEGVRLQTLKPHNHAVPAPCQHFGTCGGCSLQTLDYNTQLDHKINHVTQLFTRVGKLNPDLVATAMLNPIAADPGQRFGYRNKIQLAFSSRVWQPSAGSSSSDSSSGGSVSNGWGLGFYMPGSNTVVMPVQQCHLVGTEVNQVIAAVKACCQQHDLQPYNPATGKGELSHLIIRTAAAVGKVSTASAAEPAAAAAEVDGSSSDASPGFQIMAVIVTTEACRSTQIQPIADQIMQQCRNIGLVSVIHSLEAAAPLPAADRTVKGIDHKFNTAAGPRSNIEGSNSRHNGRSGLRSSSSSSGKRQPRALTVSSTKVLAGVPHLTERLCGLSFHISPHSFFQTNTGQAEHLYGQVVAAVQDYYQVAAAAAAVRSGTAVGDHSSGVVLDLYTGTGTIALRLAASNCCKQVTGFDVSQSAIAVAKCNAARNKITNANFVCGDLNQLAKGGLLGPGVKPDVVVVDPARGGLGRSVVNYLLNCGAKRLIYVSCNAATQARDLQLLCGDSVSDSFELRSCVAVDMYPQTGVEHVETVVVLDRHDV